ncbi:MAG: hypothetical protein E6G36_10270 [Actinobacteria bacterium]|nr:MAG: hypothetical protein E6G36_10270 [Actinomycetota bacterium]
MDLLERSTELAVLEEALRTVRASGHGSVVLVAGEAGIGKTALLNAFCGGSRGVPVVRGGCDPLFTPRALGPLLEVAEEIGGEFGSIVARGAAPAEVVQALMHDLRRRRPTILVLETSTGRCRWICRGQVRAGAAWYVSGSGVPVSDDSTSTMSARMGPSSPSSSSCSAFGTSNPSSVVTKSSTRASNSPAVTPMPSCVSRMPRPL